MTRCDVLIVGGGPAGSSCALGLQRTGLDVLVVDRRTFPRDKTCAGWITPPVIEMLGLDLVDYAQSRTLQPISGFRVGLIGGTSRKIQYGQTVSYGIRRCQFDDYLLRHCDARLLLGQPFRDWERTADGWLVNGEIETRLVVGAGGHFCPVARRLGARSDTDAAVVTAQEIEFRPEPDQLHASQCDPETPELYFCNDLKGYGWCFRKGDYLNVGLGRLEAKHLPDHVSGFTEFLRERGTLRGPFPAAFHGHAYQLGLQVPSRCVDDAVLLIGDSAGVAHPQSGEGIRPAVESGLLAAKVIASADGNYSHDRLGRYIGELRDRFGLPRTGSRSLPLPAAVGSAIGRRLLKSRLFMRHVVLDRWFLHRQQPALLSDSSNGT